VNLVGVGRPGTVSNPREANGHLCRSHVSGTLQADAAEQVASLLFPTGGERGGDRRVGSSRHLGGTSTPMTR
jgi:hypothetical protein